MHAHPHMAPMHTHTLTHTNIHRNLRPAGEPGEPPKKPFRNEIHPQQLLHLGHKYCPRGGVIMDDMAGSMPLAYVGLRLGLPIIMMERDTTGLYEAAVNRMEVAMRFLKTEGLLCAVGQVPCDPEFFELAGTTWQAEMRKAHQVSQLLTFVID